MNTPANPPYSITAKFLGPIFSLNDELTKHEQNLIFARNGIGKSFLSRAFRCLDLYRLDEPPPNTARNIVSDESPLGEGEFSFSRGSDILGQLELGISEDKAVVSSPETIFHVFSGDFVQDELREKEYILDGKIENRITVDSAKIELDDAREALEKAQSDKRVVFEALDKKFYQNKVSELVKKARIKQNLKEYKLLDIDTLLAQSTDKPSAPDQGFSEILGRLNRLSTLPLDPNYPKSIDFVKDADFDFLESLEESLKRTTSPSSVSDDLKKKIEAHHDFYETGIAILEQGSMDVCPFCEQAVEASGPKVIIETYIKYFADEEERHKSELRKLTSKIQILKDKLIHLENAVTSQKSNFEVLKQYLPSQEKSVLTDLAPSLDLVRKAISTIEDIIQEKLNHLARSHTCVKENLSDRISQLNRLIEENNTKIGTLNKAINEADKERISLQREACSVFGQEFIIDNWTEVENIKNINREVQSKLDNLRTLENSGPREDARSRVADTFETLLSQFFANKYVFDKKTFVLKRGDNEMVRGPRRTLSDGEKTAIAFCFFIASMHRKVRANSDYKRLFFIFDDPVTSMSYEYVFTIAHILKTLSVSEMGDVSLNPKLISQNTCRPRLLILTHSSYFFNISLTNRVVNNNAAFVLFSEANDHKIQSLNNYVAPFQEQLKDVYEVVKGGRSPDHTTANSIRSILEAVGRFCRPDKSRTLNDFVQHLSQEDGIKIKSTLINSLCHGSYYDEVPEPQDLKRACEETLHVVQKYAAGQLEILK